MLCVACRDVAGTVIFNLDCALQSNCAVQSRYPVELEWLHLRYSLLQPILCTLRHSLVLRVMHLRTATRSAIGHPLRTFMLLLTSSVYRYTTQECLVCQHLSARFAAQ